MPALNKSVFSRFPELHTNRLHLREIRMEDATQIFAMRSSGRVNRFIAREEMPTLQEAEKLVDKTKTAYENQQGIGWAAVLRDRPDIIGTCGFNSIDYANRRAEIGGEMMVDYWGKHLALEAVQAIVHFGVNTFLLHSIEAKVSPLNRGAIAILEHLGFVKEAHYRDRIFFKEQYSDMAVYTLIQKP